MSFSRPNSKVKILDKIHDRGPDDFNRSALQVANLGGHPVQPPFKIPESIIYYFLVASDMRITVVLIFMYTWMRQNTIVISLFEKTLFLVMWLNSLYFSDVSITVSVITTFFKVFRLFKFVNKIRCTENHLELHEWNDIYKNPINQGLILNLFGYMSSWEILRDMYLNLARSKFWDFFTNYFLDFT